MADKVAETSSPLLKADSATIAFAAEKDGSLRVRYAGWEEAKVFRPGESIELVTRAGQVSPAGRAAQGAGAGPVQGLGRHGRARRRSK
jgi:hypothetical protein